MDKKLQIEKIKKEMTMIRKVQSGEHIKCPACGDGILDSHGPRISCSNRNCNAEYTLDY